MFSKPSKNLLHPSWVALPLFFLPVFGFAQAVSNYQVVSGTAMGATPLTYWTFNETAGSTETVCVAINITSVPSLQFSPRVELYDPNGVPYFGAEFDLQGAHICNRSWTATGTYKIGVFNTLGGPSQNPGAAANFDLEFVRPGQPFAAGQLGGGSLVPGVPASGSVKGEYYQLWSVPANAGDLVTVTATNVTGDTPGYVDLTFQGYDPNGGEISTSSDDPPVYAFRANSTGIYTILVFQVSGGNPLANPMTYTITATGSTAQLPPVALLTQVAATASGLAYSRVSQTFNGTVTVRNVSSNQLTGPFQIVFLGITANVTLTNATGIFSGTPYLTIPAAPSLAPGQSVTVNVQFKNPSNTTMTLTPVIYSGNIN